MIHNHHTLPPPHPRLQTASLNTEGVVYDEDDTLNRVLGIPIHHEPILSSAPVHALENQIAPRRAETDGVAETEDFLDGRVDRVSKEGEMVSYDKVQSRSSVGDVEDWSGVVGFEYGEIVRRLTPD